jgi:hypothetical protein
MDYFDDFDNRFLNKYKKILKIKKFINMFFYLWIDSKLLKNFILTV